MRIPIKTIRTPKYRVELYSGQGRDYFKVVSLINEKHIATFYSEEDLQSFIKE